MMMVLSLTPVSSECLDQLADLSIDVADAGVVGVEEGAGEVVAEGTEFRDAGAGAEFERGVEAHGGAVFGASGLGGELILSRS